MEFNILMGNVKKYTANQKVKKEIKEQSNKK